MPRARTIGRKENAGIQSGLHDTGKPRPALEEKKKKRILLGNGGSVVQMQERAFAREIKNLTGYGKGDVLAAPTAYDLYDTGAVPDLEAFKALVDEFEAL